MTMFRSPSYLEGKNFVKFDLNTPLIFPGNGQIQRKDMHKFAVADRDNLYDWYNAYFYVEYTFEATANGVATDKQSAPINGSFSLIKQLTIKSAGKVIYTANEVHKILFIKSLLDFSDDYARSVAKSQFWCLDSDGTTVTADAATNAGIRQRALRSQDGVTVKTTIPLNRYSFIEGLQDRRCSLRSKSHFKMMLN